MIFPIPHSMLFYSHEQRLVFQEVPRSEGQIPPQQAQLSEQREQLAAQFGPQFQKAIEKLLPHTMSELQRWGEQPQRAFTYNSKMYQIKYIDRIEQGEGEQDQKRRVGLGVSQEQRLSVQGRSIPQEHFLNDMLAKQIAIYRIEDATTQRPVADQGSTSKALRYQVIFDPLRVTIEFDVKSGDLYTDTKGKTSTAAELQKVLEFVETELPKIALAAKVVSNSESDPR